MAKRKPSQDSYKRKSDKLKSQIDALAASLYGLNNRDQGLRYYNLQTYQIEVMRNFVFYMHLGIEDLLRALLFDFLVKRNQQLTKKRAIRIVEDLWSADLVDWCGRLKLIKPKQYKQLLELNRVRNKCGHNWSLEVKRKRVKTGGKSRRVRVPSVIFEGRNLFDEEVFTSRFLKVYSKIYLKLLSIVWKLEGRI